MKKIFFILSLMLIPLYVFAEQDFGVSIPEWSDYAPTAFVNVKEPKGLGKLNVTAKYWYQRKVEFENELSECRAMESSEERFKCYEILKTKQYKENNDYNARLEAQMNGNSSIPGMESRTDNMLPIGSYLNQMTRFMPSEVR